MRATSSSQRKLLGDTIRSYTTVGRPIAENAERTGGDRSRCCSTLRVTDIEGPDAVTDRS